jgi:hypothetical protein
VIFLLLIRSSAAAASIYAALGDKEPGFLRFLKGLSADGILSSCCSKPDIRPDLNLSEICETRAARRFSAITFEITAYLNSRFKFLYGIIWL